MTRRNFLFIMLTRIIKKMKYIIRIIRRIIIKNNFRTLSTLKLIIIIIKKRFYLKSNYINIFEKVVSINLKQ